MKTETIVLTFLGTRGEIAARSRQHQRHSSLLIQGNDARIMIDCGGDWLNQMPSIHPTAIVLTHAHPDHAAGLAKGAPCPVYATKETFDLIGRYPIDDRRRVQPRRTLTISGVKFKGFPVEHSIRAPAVGYRVSTEVGSFFYVPDVANLPNAARTLRGATLYVGDGATMKRSMVRKRNGKLIGHATIAAQLGWCAMAHVGRAIFTHCGSRIVRADARKSDASIRELGHEYGVDAQLACDGDRLALSYDGWRRRMYGMPNVEWQ